MTRLVHDALDLILVTLHGLLGNGQARLEV
jgi:hypothetical protein